MATPSRCVPESPSIASGIRKINIVKDMPNWWVLKIIDGFGAHTSSEAAMEIYSEHKILLLKERRRRRPTVGVQDDS